MRFSAPSTAPCRSTIAGLVSVVLALTLLAP
jgi:hypothetical protein